MKKYIFIFLVSLLLNFSGFCQIEKGNIEFFIDSTSKMSIEEATKTSKFRVAKNNVPSVGINPNVVWMKVLVKNNSSKSENIYTQIFITYIDTVQYFVVKKGILIEKSAQMGWRRLIKKQSFNSPNHLYKYKLEAHEEIELYIRTIKTQGSVRLPIEIEAENVFFEETINTHEFWGWFAGIGFIIIILNTFLFLLLKEKVYFYYTLYVFAQIGEVITTVGIHGDWYFGGFLSVSGRNVPNVFVTLFVTSNLLFVSEFLRIKNYHSKKLVKCVNYLILIGFLLIFLFFTPLENIKTDKAKYFFSWVYTVYFWLPILVSLFLLLYSIFKQKERTASLVYFFAGTPLFIKGSLLMLENIQLLPAIYNNHKYEAAKMISFEIVVLCLWLAFRVKQYADERENLLQEKSKNQQIAYETGILMQNQERSRLAKELHDGVGIDLSIVKMKLESLKMDFEKRNLNNEINILTDGIKNIDEITSEIRSFSHSLMPPDLENNGIVVAIQNLVANLNKVHPNIEINFTTNIEENLENNISQNVYFIVKELVNNALRHAKAKIIDIELMQEKKQIELRIADDGIGYNFEKERKKRGLGLRSIQSRVELMKAQFEVKAKPIGGVLHQIFIKR
jgi:signal transduction histidine kinase